MSALEQDAIVSPHLPADGTMAAGYARPKLTMMIDGTVTLTKYGSMIVIITVIVLLLFDKKAERPTPISAISSNMTFYSAGSGDDVAYRLEIDRQGYVYVTGSTTSEDFLPDGKMIITTKGASDAFVLKLSPDLKNVIYFKTIGGSGEDFSHDIIVDDDGDAYIIGMTKSSDFPASQRYIPPLKSRSAYSIFLVKLAPDGERIMYSTLVGGSLSDKGYALSFYKGGTVFSGASASNDFPMLMHNYVRNDVSIVEKHGFSDTLEASLRRFFGKKEAVVGVDENGIVAFIDKDGRLSGSVIFGGRANEEAEGIAVDEDGNIYTGGMTYSPDFPIVGEVIQTTYAGKGDAFLVKLNGSGEITKSSLFGGFDGADDFHAVAVKEGHVYGAGFSYGRDFPVSETAFQRQYAGNEDSVLLVMDPEMKGISYSTYIGGSSREDIHRIVVDEEGRVYATGETGSTDHPVSEDAVQKIYSGGERDAFVVVVGPSGKLAYSTFIGESGKNSLNGIALSPNGDVYVAGQAQRTGAPHVRAFCMKIQREEIRRTE